jgi:4-hydroxybenzoate polyprenyltransferase
MHTIKTLINKIETATSSLRGVFIMFITIVFVRTFFENFTNSNNAGFLNGPTDTFFHYPLWWAALLLANIILIYVLTKRDVMKVTNVVTLSFFATLIVPAIDIVRHGFLGHTYDFITGSYPELLHHFITFTFSSQSFGLGGKIETILAVLGVGFYVYMTTNNRRILKSLLGGLGAYIILFFFLSLPTHIFAVANLLPGIVNTIDLHQAFKLSQTTLNSAEPLLRSVDIHTIEYTYFSRKISIVFAFCVLGLLGILLALKKRLWIVVRHMRWEHILHILLFLSAGLYLGSLTNIHELPHALFLNINIIAVITSTILACFFIVCDNDEADVKVDTISQSKRPLVSGAISKKEWQYLKHTSLFFSLVIAWLANYFIFTCIGLFMLLYHNYSKPPLRIKKIPILSSLSIVLSALFVFTAGFFTTNQSFNLGDLPFQLILGIFIIYFLVENIKNMKDIVGDRANNIYTLPVLLGKSAGLGMSTLVILAAIFSILFFPFSQTTTILTLLFTAGIVFFINKKPYSEKSVFLLYFTFFIILVLNSSLF